MSSKKAYYFHKNFNWKEVNNLFAYDVKHPERLSKRQQILRLYKNCGRRIYELEMLKFQFRDLHGFAKRMNELREDFETLKYAKTEQEVDEKLEKYEQFIEYTFQVTPWVHDNVSYEWRHAKGLPVFTKEEVETDLHGYYDKRLLNYYPKAREWQYRDEYPWDDTMNPLGYSPNDWEDVNINDNSMSQSDVKTPEQFQKEVEQLKEKYALKTPDLWQRDTGKVEHSQSHNQPKH